MKKLYVSALSAIFAAVVFAGNALAAADPTLVTETGKIQTFFTDNIGTVIALFVGISMLLWVLGMAFRSVGVGRPKKVG